MSRRADLKTCLYILSKDLVISNSAEAKPWVAQAFRVSVSEFCSA